MYHYLRRPDFVDHAIRFEKDLAIFRFHSGRELMRTRTTIRQSSNALGRLAQAIKHVVGLLWGIMFRNPLENTLEIAPCRTGDKHRVGHGFGGIGLVPARREEGPFPFRSFRNSPMTSESGTVLPAAIRSEEHA